MCPFRRRSVQRIAQTLPRLELGLFRRGDLDLFAGARVASLGCVPNPTRRTSSPAFSASPIDSNTASTALLASDFRNSVLPATASTSSFLFTGLPPALLRVTIRSSLFAVKFSMRPPHGQPHQRPSPANSRHYGSFCTLHGSGGQEVILPRIA